MRTSVKQTNNHTDKYEFNESYLDFCRMLLLLSYHWKIWFKMSFRLLASVFHWPPTFLSKFSTHLSHWICLFLYTSICHGHQAQEGSIAASVPYHPFSTAQGTPVCSLRNAIDAGDYFSPKIPLVAIAVRICKLLNILCKIAHDVCCLVP